MILIAAILNETTLGFDIWNLLFSVVNCQY